MPKITVIVTIHNAEKYLRECIDSVIAQSFQDIEILCMDGGSTDQSPKILREYATKDHRIRIINDTNTSYGHKVNEGIRQAKGEYISVLESDDMYQVTMLEKLYYIAEKYHPDYVNADYLNFFDIDGKRRFIPVKMYKEEDYGKLLESQKHLEDMRQILRYWTGIFRRDFLIQKNIKMNESPGASFQDMSFRFLTSALAETTYHLEEPVYLYRIDNPGSSVYNPKKAVVIADEFDFLKEELIKRKIENISIWKHFYIWKYNDFYGNLCRFGKEARKALFIRCYNELDKDRALLESSKGETYSVVLADLLGKSQEEIWTDIGRRFQNNQDRENYIKKIFSVSKQDGIIIFGCGIRGKRALTDIEFLGAKEQISYLTDNMEALWGSQLEDYFIISPEETIKRCPNALYLIANKYYANDIYKQLQSYGVDKERLVIFQ